MRMFILGSLLVGLLPAVALGQDFKMEPGPKSPEDSLKAIKVRPGFKVELMVAEPLVKSPIAFAWGPDGKFWVVEMGDYPLGIDGKGKPGGRIKYLEKSKPDGPYDKMTVFMEDLGFPTGVFPYGKGILVTCAPDIFYAEATRGTGNADRKDILFTGFKEGNQQHRVNGLTWGIDNWIYGANGDSGGVVKSIKTGKEVDIRGRDFRFKVDTGEFEAVTGPSQFGRCRDDWGNWFGNNNTNPMYHYALDDCYLSRNPHVLYPDPKVQVSVKPGASEVFPISKPLPRFNSPQAVNHFTSACSTIIYRDTLFGPAFEGNSFVSEPVHNLVHREIMKPKGVTFTSQRADDEQTSEFLASSDNWFRPTMIQTGPDGALWVADMYRYVIEHPQWIPKDWQKKLDLRAGHDKGRIYRIYPADKKPRAIVRMDKMKVEELVKQLESPNGWTRDTAHQILVKREKREFSDDEWDRATRALRDMTEEKKFPQARLHAIYAYEKISGGWKFAPLNAFLKDTHPAIRKHAVTLMEESFGLWTDVKIMDALERDPDGQVRQQFAYTLHRCNEIFKYEARLARLLCAKTENRDMAENVENTYILAAGISSIWEKNWKVVFTEIMKQDQIPAPLFAPMIRLSKKFGEPLEVSQLLVRQVSSQQDLPLGQQIFAIGETVDVMNTREMSLIELVQSAGAKDIQSTLQQLKKIHADAVRIVADPKAPMSDKLLAVRLLGNGLGNDREDHKLMVAFLTPRTPDELQAAVIQNLGRNFDPRVPGLLLTPWKSYSPALRGQVLDLLLSRPIWTRMTVEALQNKQIPANEVDAIRRQRLLHHKDDAIRLEAAKIFHAPSNTDRGRVADEYWLRLPDKNDKERGAKLFTKSCAACHQFGGAGNPVGPDLAAVGDKSPQGLLIAILDPNRAVESRYINYLASTKAGLTYTGIITSETSTNITLALPDGKKQQLLRNELDELVSTGKSMMPDGLEKDLSPQDLADIIEFVRANQQAPKPKTFPGNQPQTVRPDKNGVLLFTPKNGVVWGPSIIIEPQLGNLGWWHSPEDHVVWTVELEKEGFYRVWIDYACANDSAGNTLLVRAARHSRILHKVAGTGRWDQYRSIMIGQVDFIAGKHEFVVRSEGRLRGALLDLKEVKLVPR